MHSGEQQQIRSVVARATPLWDRNVDTALPAAPLDRKRIKLRLARWQEILEDAEGLKRRLQGSSLNARALKKVLRGVESAVDGSLPSWASILEDISSLQTGRPSNTGLSEIEDRMVDPARPFPFQEILTDFVRYAGERVRIQTGSAFEVLDVSAVIALERQLLAHLTFVASLTIGQDFHDFRFQRAPASAFESAWQEQNPSTEIYSAYVQHMRSGGLIELLGRYPVLARLLCQSTGQWINTSTQFCQRFEQDFHTLQAFFGWKIKQPAAAIAALRTGLSDRHRGGQSVIECILQSGERVFYKPRTLKPEVAFYTFIRWLNQRGLRRDLKVLQALDRITHGWIESVPCVPCCTTAEVENFYVRAGMLLAALYVLGVTDIHCENLIASGEHPVIVDLETLLNGDLPAPPAISSPEDHENQLGNEPSVLITGLLPRWQTSLAGQKFDMSALGADGTQDPDVRVSVWRRVNTDQMMLTDEARHESALTHRVRLGDELPSVADHLPAFLSGFKEVYFVILENRQRLLSDGPLLDMFDDLDLRILVRSTTTYAGLHLHLLHPEFLKDGIDRSIELEWLARPLCSTTVPSEGHQRVYEYERTAMENLDIPHFGTLTWKNLEYSSDDEDLWMLYARHDSEGIRRRLAGLSSEDYQKQCAIADDAIKSRFAPK